jgi:hypothetical protein
MTSFKARPMHLLGRTEEIHKEPQAVESVCGFESRPSEYESGVSLTLIPGPSIIIFHLFTKIHHLAYRFVFKRQK